METCNSSANHFVLHSQINRRSLGPIEASNCNANDALLHAQNDR